MFIDGRYSPIQKESWVLSLYLPVVLVVVGWGPLYALDVIAFFQPRINDKLREMGFAMAWGMAVALPTTALTGILIIVHIGRCVVWLIAKLLDRGPGEKRDSLEKRGR